MKMIFALLISTFMIQAAQARTWDRVQIPGALCGDGRPYSVFVDLKPRSKNVLIEFMGGGACWDYKSCYGDGLNVTELRTWMHPMLEFPFYSYVTSDVWFVSKHPFTRDSAVYLPYCTGDVFSANHKAMYDGVPVYHQGYRNVLLTLKYLKEKNLINFEQTERLTVWGASAGAIGAFVHMKNIEPYFPKARKIAIIDSAGLHFGKTFWHKFTPELFNDYVKSFGKIGLNISYDDGFVAKNMGPVLSLANEWTIGIMQSTRDWVMSSMFGEISPADHKSLVLSDQGIAAIAKPHKNTSVWVSDSSTHTFLILPITACEKGIEEESAMGFVNDLIAKSAARTDLN